MAGATINSYELICADVWLGSFVLLPGVTGTTNLKGKAYDNIFVKMLLVESCKSTIATILCMILKPKTTYEKFIKSHKYFK